MTGTIHEKTVDTETHIEIDTYADQGMNGKRFRGTGCAKRFTLDDLGRWALDCVNVNDKESVNELQTVINAFREAGKVELDHIWLCEGVSGYDNLYEFHALRHQAEIALTNHMDA